MSRQNLALQMAIAVIGLALPTICLAQAVCPPTPGAQPVNNRIKYTMYLGSKPLDAANCAMEVRDGQVRILPPTSNPAMSCPDMFAWKIYAEVIKQEFWKAWASDPDTWPSVPLPLCRPGTPPAQCCTPGAATNPGYDNPDYPAQNCPYFPGAHLTAEQVVQMRIGQPPSKAHIGTLAASPELRARILATDPGRKVRQSMAELVFRNRPMFDFVFVNDLYNQQGLQRVFKRNSDAIRNGAPYRLKSLPNALTEIDFPADALMIKSNWLNEARAKEFGMTDDPQNPYIKMTIKTAVDDNDAPIFEPGVHWLVGFHISSKDTPNWVWATFEHVNNAGRCDFTGCSDSYGYSSPDNVSAEQETNFTTPHVKCDDLLLASWVFDPGKRYAGGARSPGLANVFRGLNIGTATPGAAPAGAVLIPSASDPAWLSYRLKGTQTQFTDSTGFATRLGNSVTEGGFVSTSSCISCHARAGLTSAGTAGPLGLGVFINELSEAGYLQSSMGVPLPGWYHGSAQPPALKVLQSDFVWGFLAASCIKSQPTEGCPATPAIMLSVPSGQQMIPPSVRRRIRELQ